MGTKAPITNLQELHLSKIANKARQGTCEVILSQIESKKLWHIVGPAIFSRVSSYSMNVITQVFAGHLGDLELATLSIANNVIIVKDGKRIGDTMRAGIWGQEVPLVGNLYATIMDCSVLLLLMYLFATPVLKWMGQPDDVAEQSGMLALWLIPLHFSFAFQFPLQRFLQSQLKTEVIA